MNEFNFINSKVAKNPLDFTYEFGLNDNSASYFNYNEISILTTAMTPVVTTMTQIQSTLIDSNAIFSNNEEYEVSSIPIHSVSNVSTISTETLEKMSTSFDTASFVHDMISAAIGAFSSITNTLPQQKVEQVDGNGRFDFIDSNGNRTSTDTSKDIQFALDVINLSISSLQLIGAGINAYFSIKESIEGYKDYCKLIDKKIEQLNEKIDANAEFIQQAKESIDRRAKRFEVSNRVINGKTK